MVAFNILSLSMAAGDTTAIETSLAIVVIFSKSSSRADSDNCLESLSSGMLALPRLTAAATTGPLRAPLPASSQP